MSVFTKEELSYLQNEGLLARVATVSKDGTPHIAPVGMWSRNAELDTIDLKGMNFDHTKKFRDVARRGRAAVVVDDLVKLNPAEREKGGWDSRPRGIEIRGRAEAITDPEPMIRLYPERVISWGLESPDKQNARNVA